MKKSRFTEQQIVGVLKEAEAGAKTSDLYRKHGISPAMFYAWKSKFGGMEVSDVAKLVRNRSICAASRRKTTISTICDRDAKPAPDLVERRFTAHGPNQLWVSDITYVPTCDPKPEN